MDKKYTTESKEKRMIRIGALVMAIIMGLAAVATAIYYFLP